MVNLYEGQSVSVNNVSLEDTPMKLNRFTNIDMNNVRISQLGLLVVSFFENLVIEDSIISNSTTKSPLYLVSGKALSLSNVKMHSLFQPVILQNIQEVKFSTVELVGCLTKDSSPITISGCNSVDVQDSTFTNNTALAYGGAIYISEAVKMWFQGNVFHSNKGTNGGAIYCGICNRFELNCNLVFWTTNTFESNYGSNLGGAVYIHDVESIVFEKATLTGNSAQNSGGAIFVQNSYDFQVTHSTIRDNQVLTDQNELFSQQQSNSNGQVDVASSSNGCGGAVTSFSEYFYTYKSDYQRNMAPRGGAIAVSKPSTNSLKSIIIEECTFKENNATLTGNDGYLMSIERQDTEQTIDLPANVSITSTQYDLELEDYGPRVIYPGQQISMKIVSKDFFGQKVKLGTQNLIYKISDILLSFDTSKFDEDIVLVTAYATKKEVLNSERELYLLTKDGKFSYAMQSVEFNGAKGLVCLKFVDLEVVLGIVIPVSLAVIFIGISLGLITFFLVRFIYSKLSTLKKKERAESTLEQKIIDKKIVFQFDETNYEEVSIPMMDLKKPSYIIPIEDIELVKKLAEGGMGIVYFWKAVEESGCSHQEN